MAKIFRLETFDRWLAALRDKQHRARILARIDRLADGNPGDTKPVGGGVHELRCDFGPGFRVYYAKRGAEVIILLAGGDKASQDKDIKTAKRLVSELDL